MNKLLLILCIFLISSCSKEIFAYQLVVRNGLSYEVNSQTPFTGTIIDKYENGQLRLKGSYKDGKKEGPWEIYRPWEHYLFSKGSYKDGKKGGPWEYYHDNGQLNYKGSYKDGKEEGPWEIYHDNGQLSFKRSYKDGKKEGPWEYYHENSQLSLKGSYKDGKKGGPWEYYHENGQLSKIDTYKDGNIIRTNRHREIPINQ